MSASVVAHRIAAALLAPYYAFLCYSHRILRSFHDKRYHHWSQRHIRSGRIWSCQPFLTRSLGHRRLSSDAVQMLDRIIAWKKRHSHNQGRHYRYKVGGTLHSDVCYRDPCLRPVIVLSSSSCVASMFAPAAWGVLGVAGMLNSSLLLQNGALEVDHFGSRLGGSD